MPTVEPITSSSSGAVVTTAAIDATASAPEALPVEPSIGDYTVGVTLDNRPYVLRMRWNSRDQAWFLDVLAENLKPIRTGIKVVLDAALGRECTDPLYPQGVITASDTSNQDREATIDDMGVRVGLFYYNVATIRALAGA